MADKLYAVVPRAVEDTGKISFIFMRDSGAPWEEMQRISNHWGAFLRHERPNFEPGWWVMLIRHSGEASTWILNDGEDIQAFMEDLVDTMPNAVMLVNPALIGALTEACLVRHVTLTTFRFDGTLKTSS